MCMADLNEPDSPFCQSSSHDALPCEVFRSGVVHTIEFACCLALAGEVCGLGRSHLHPKGKLEAFHSVLEQSACLVIG